MQANDKNIDDIVNKLKIRNFYRIGKLLGQGAFGEVRMCIHRELCTQRAVKILKESRMGEEQQKIQMNEVRILQQLDHPNIVKMFDVFKDKKYFYIVTEICKGGELYDEIVNKGKLKEIEAATLMRQLLMSVNYMHKSGVIHRDLKPENILLEDSKDYSQIKVIDFGTAIKMENINDFNLDNPGEPSNIHLQDKIGTPYYIAPEVLQEDYDHKCDIWSCGVVAFVLLSGVKPFNGSSDQEVFKAIKKEKPNFKTEFWLGVSKNAIEFTQWLLTQDKTKRPTAEQALAHPWIKENAQTKIDQKDLEAAISQLRQFKLENKFMQAAYKFISNQLLTQQEKEPLAKVFKAFDDGNGMLSQQEFQQAVKQLANIDLNAEEVSNIFQNVDLNGSGLIEYSEFVTGSIKDEDLLTDNKLLTAFQMFDCNENGESKGSITAEEMKDLLQLDAEEIGKIIQSVDKDGSGSIEFEEFKQMMTKHIKREESRSYH